MQEILGLVRRCVTDYDMIQEGETGAGKSIILGALGLLTGNRADARQVKTGAPKCVVEATFSTGHDIYGTIKKFFDDNDLDFVADECILRREVVITEKPG